MILVDIGNTNIHFAWERKEKIVKDSRFSTTSFSLRVLQKLLTPYPREEILICSVVPKVTKIFRKLKRKIYVVGKEVKVPIGCRYNFQEVGQDRLLNAYGAKCLYKHISLIVDFGSAVTFDFISSQGEYEGGFIFPGIKRSLDALLECALLPKKIDWQEYSLRGIPKNTQESIIRGIKEGFSLLVNGLVATYSPKGKKMKKVLITGGDAPLVLNSLDFPFIFEPLLTLKALIFLKRYLREVSL